MPQNEPLTPPIATPTEQFEISPAVAKVMERAHSGAMLELERFEADETNPFRYYLRKANETIGYILGQEAKPENFSHIISLKKRLRDQEAANDDILKEAA